MSKYVFLFKENDTDDRDCVRYIDISDLEKNHLCIDRRFNVCGSCYSMSLKPEIPYEEITTVLTRKEYDMLCNPEPDADYTRIIDKLQGIDNEVLFQQVQTEETEWLMEEYNLSEEDVEDIFDHYNIGYHDRSIVCCIFKDVHDLGYEEAVSLGYMNEKDPISFRYFNYEQFGKDIVAEDDFYMELSDGRIVKFNY